MVRALLTLSFVALPLSLFAAPLDVNQWLAQNPKVANAIAWEFPDTLPKLPNSKAKDPTAGKWLMGLKSPIRVEAMDYPPMASCPAVQNLTPPGKSLLWCQWPQSYRERLKTYFDFYWNWMESSWALYRQYREGGFAEKPPGFDERFASTLDPETGGEPGTLPYAAEIVSKTSNGHDFHYVAFDAAATIDAYLKTTALQLVLNLGPFLNWKLADYDSTDQSVILNGKALFQYVPAGAKPWGNELSGLDREGYITPFQVPASPLALMKFLMRHGLIRETRFETVSAFFDWERMHLIHGGSDLYDRVGGCDNDFNEIQWGFKGPAPVMSVLHGRPLTCTKPPMGYDGELSPYEIHADHYIQGCITSGPLRHTVMRQINIAVENFCFKGGHCSTRFVVEKSLLDGMLSQVEPSLPLEPSFEDDHPSLSAVDESIFAEMGISDGKRLVGSTIPPPANSPRVGLDKGKKVSTLANAYLDHNDTPYSLWGEWEIAPREALISEPTFQRWFPEIPENLPQEQETTLIETQQRHVGLRFQQLIIARLPLSLFQMYCYSGDREKPRDKMSIYTSGLDSYYGPVELEKSGFWERFERKYQELGGCEHIPPREFRGFPPD